ILIPFMRSNIDYYRKVGTRKANALSKLSVAGSAFIEDSQIIDFRVAFGAVAPTVIRDKKLEKEIIGININQIHLRIDDIVEKYRQLIKPITDQRSTEEYRRETAINLLRDFLLKIAGAESF
ncbi:MAG: hypothetical protein PHR06_10890, partial [Candidatus Cloacimonetes bacterium]|nr:hypothetical protein [Candidatus Cloacimonadota bacterium]